MQEDRAAIELPRAYRNPALRRNAYLFPVLLLMAVLPIGARLHAPAAWVLLFAGYVLVSGWLAYAFLRVRVVADRDGLVVVNYFSTQRLPWSEVRSIGDPPYLDTTGTIVLVDGRRVRARALRVVRVAQGAGYILGACRELQAIQSAQLVREDAARAPHDV